MAYKAWERQGRGWHLNPYPTDLEPALQPMALAERPKRGRDDGRFRTPPELLWAGAQRLWRRWRGEGVPEVSPAPEPRRLERADLVELLLSPDREFRANSAAVLQVLLSLPSRHGAVAFEVIADSREIGCQFAVEEHVAPEVERQLEVQLPGLVVAAQAEGLSERWTGSADTGGLVVEFALAETWLQSLVGGGRPVVSHLLPLIASLGGLEGDEFVVLQCLFQRCSENWVASADSALVTLSSGPHAHRPDDLIKAARAKFETPLFAATLRLGLRATAEARAWRMAQGVYRALQQVSLGASNALMPLDPGRYGDDARERDLLARQSQRSGMLLSATELASLVALPDGDAPVLRLRRVTGRTRAMPDVLAEGAVRLGVNRHRGASQDVYLPVDLRRRHVHLIGASGTGKSTLMLQMAMQDLEAGRGLALIDPHGDLVDEVLARMPASRHGDLVLVDPADPDFTVGFNVLQAKTDLERQLLSSDLVATFRRLSTSWGDQMTSVLGNAVLAFLEHPEGGTLADLRRFLVEPTFRRRHLAGVTDEEVRYFWEKEYTLLSGRPQAPLLTRLDTFLRHRLVREMVAQRKSTFDLRQIMDGRGVLLVRLSQGAIGEENAALLAAFFVSRLQQAAQSRQELAEARREDFTLYLDEFHNYLTPSMAAILSGARKYRLGLVLAHQDLSQLGRREDGVLGAAISNPATRVCFRLGDRDARSLTEGFAHFEAKDLQSLGVGEAICRVQQADQDFNLRTEALTDAEDAQARRRVAAEVSRTRHARPRSEVRAALAASRESVTAKPNVPASAAVSDTPHKTSSEEVSTAAPEQPPKATPSPGPANVEQESAVQSTPVTATPMPRGRGGPSHRALQARLKEVAQAKGWKARIEGTLPEQAGFVDVLLERDGVLLGVEIGLTTDAEHEFANIEKCLAGGCERVLTIHQDRAVRETLKARIKSDIAHGQRSTVVVASVAHGESVLTRLLERTQAPTTRSRGYKVRVEKQAGSSADAEGALRDLLSRLWQRRQRGP